MENKCFKCGTTVGKIIPHHISYKPEKIVFCCWSCHQTIHYKIRKNNLCPLSIEETNRLSKISSVSRYNKENIERIDFWENLTTNIYLVDQLLYNKKTGNIIFNSSFRFH